jgi:hypothetical protein
VWRLSALPVEDWALSLEDEGRLHLWLMPDGRWIMHRDFTDPARGPIHGLVHLMTETRIGPTLVLLGAVAVGVTTLLASSRA